MSRAARRPRLLPLGVLGLALVIAVLFSPTVPAAVLTGVIALLLAVIGAGRSLARRGPWGPADDITTIRLGLLLVFTALVLGATGFGWAAVAVAALALALDAVDGQVARRTGRTGAGAAGPAPEPPPAGSAAGPRDTGANDAGAAYDENVDALVVLVLSLGLVPLWGWWCALPGLLFYAFRAVRRFRPAWRRPLPPSGARKVVAASQGVLLLTAGSPPALAVPPLGVLCAAAALLALGWSFGRDVVWLERRRALLGRRRPEDPGALPDSRSDPGSDTGRGPHRL